MNQPTMMLGYRINQPAISDTVIAVVGMGRDARIYDIQSGELLWSSGSASANEVYIDGDKVYAVNHTHLGIYDLADGRQTRSLVLDSERSPYQSRLVDDGVMLFSYSRAMKVVDVDQGSLLWLAIVGIDRPVLLWPPLAEEDAVYYSWYNASIMRYDGSVKWAIRADDERFIALPEYVNGSLFLMFGDGSLRQIDPNTGQEIGRFIVDRVNATAEDNDEFMAGLATYRDRLYVTFGCSTLYIFEPTN